ncbi:MAG: translation initiation factor IF-2 subunit alpha [Thermoplasmatales archaeon]|nr:MAG: translation initiation factor IF-2 subunit alpha [Thermoplasmatales archaeon]
MIKKEFPEEGELVVGTVIKVQNFGAFVTLDEYPGKEGFIHIAEIATGWVKRIRNHIKEKQKVVCKVLHVDMTKQHVDLSLKRVNEHQRRDKIQEWKNKGKSEKLLEMVAKKIGKSKEQCYKDFAEDLIKKYGTLYTAFEEAAYDIDTLKKDGYKNSWIDTFEEIAKSNITIPFVNIKGYIDVKSWLPDGVKHIRDAFILAENSEYEDVEIKIKYVGAPHYMITVKAPDYKIAEDELKKAVEKIQNNIKQFKGECEFHRKLEE